MTARAAIFLLACGLLEAQPSDAVKRWWSQVKILAADEMEGRDTGSAGYQRAAQYVAGQFEREGLQPAGVSGYFQSVPLQALRVAADQAEIALVHGSKVTPLRLNYDIAVAPRKDLPAVIDAPLVFAGYALLEKDFEGLSLKGSVVAVFTGTPPGQTPAQRVAAAAERTRMLSRAGAVGMLAIDNPRAIEPPRWPVAYSVAMSIDGAARTGPANNLLAARLNSAYAEELFQGSGHSFAEILDLASAGRPLPHFALPARLRARIHVTEEKLASDNILAVLPGSDPALANEYLVVSAHLDGYGFGEPVNGDRIYNGAFDDASCVADLIELAQDLHRAGKRFRRSVLFAVFTGEEKGLLGSNYFVSHLTVPKERVAADINLDYLRPIFPLKILTTLGLEESTLGDAVRQVAGPLGIRIQGDDEPERGLFRRSDQYNFIRNGIPGVAFIFGYEKGSPEEAIYRKWYAERYHRPSDDVNQPVDWDGAGKFQVFFERLVETVADAGQRPHWLPSSAYAHTGNTR